MFCLKSSQIFFKGQLFSTSQKLLQMTREFPGFSIGSKQDFQVANLPLATVNFKPQPLSNCEKKLYIFLFRSHDQDGPHAHIW